MDQFCPKCKTLLRVVSHGYVIRDKHLYIRQELACMNPNCENEKEVLDKAETEFEVTNE